MIPGDKKFLTKNLSAQINSARLSFADAKDMLQYLDIRPGSVSVFGLMNDHKNSLPQLMQLILNGADLKFKVFNMRI